MDFLRRIYEAVKRFFGNLTTNQKMSLLMVVASLVVAFVVLMALSRREAYVSAGVTVEGPAIGATRRALADAGIPARFEAGKVMVPRGRLEDALSVIAASAGDTGVTFSFDDLVNEQGLSMRTAEERRTMYRIALQNALASFVKKFAGVTGASVVVDLPRDRLRLTARDKGTATVTFQTRQGLELSNREYLSIARMVASSSRFLDPGRVGITNTSTGYSWKAPKKGEVTADGNDRLMLQKATAQFYREHISGLLAKIGSENYEVRVFTKLDMNVESVDQELPDEKTAIVAKEETTEETRGATRGGTPGVTPNTSASVPGGGRMGSGYSKKTMKKPMLLQASVKKIHTVKPPGELLAATVSVVVNSDRIDEIAAERTGVKDDQGKIDEAKRAAAAQQILADYRSLIRFPGLKDEDMQFKAIPFVRPAAAMAAAMPEPWLKDFLTKNLGVLGLLALGLIAVLFVFAQARKAMPEPELPEIPEYKEVERAVEESLKLEPDADVVRVERMSQRIQEFVQENPRASASLVKRWILKEP